MLTTKARRRTARNRSLAPRGLLESVSRSTMREIGDHRTGKVTGKKTVSVLGDL